MIQNDYGERRIAIGVDINGGLVEVFVSSPDRGVAGNTYSIVMTHPRTGWLCMLSHGSSYQDLPPPPPAEEPAA